MGEYVGVVAVASEQCLAWSLIDADVPCEVGDVEVPSPPSSAAVKVTEIKVRPNELGVDPSSNKHGQSNQQGQQDGTRGFPIDSTFVVPKFSGETLVPARAPLNLLSTRRGWS